MNTAFSPKAFTGSIAAAISDLATLLGPRLSTAEAVRHQHGSNVTWHVNQPPDAVVFPTSTEEVAAIVRICAAHRVPIIPFGTGTGLEGHVNAPFGGISIDTSHLNRILEVNPRDFDARVEAGVTREALNDHLRDQGLFFPVDPGANASLGGMASTRASGTNAVRYGTMRENVMAVTAVLPNGEIVTTASRARKSSAGYDLTHLLVGAEGTLGIITEVTLRLHGIPEAISAGVCAFDTIEQACDAAITAIQSGIPIARVELIDELQIRGTNLHSNLGLPEKPHLFLEFHGTAASVAEQADLFGTIAADHGSQSFTWAERPEDRHRLWKARHEGYWAQIALRPGARTFATDVCVPISKLAENVLAAKRDVEELGLICCILGHIGDGNFHCVPLVMVDDADEMRRVHEFSERLVLRAIAAGGTCTGEHGIGQDKRKYMPHEYSPATLAAMRALKQAWDPDGIMNPGKIFLE